MAFMMSAAGFNVKDIHMTDIISGRESLEDIQLLVAVGGFSNSDVLGSAKGWAGSFIFNSIAKKALENFYYNLNDNLWGEYGFYDAFSVHYNWYSEKYIAIDQGPILLMIENYRTQLLWNLFMQDQDIISGLTNLGFNF